MEPRYETTTHEVEVRGAKDKVKFDLELIPADQLPDILAKNTNIARVNVGGKDFLAVIGKTRTGG